MPVFPDKARKQSTRDLSNFIFDKKRKMTLVQSVAEHEAHLVAHGLLDRRFEKVRETLIEKMPPATWLQQVKPSVKTLRDKFRTMKRYRRQVDCSETILAWCTNCTPAPGELSQSSP